MIHETLKEKLLMFEDSELPEEERREISAHLQNCAECSVRLEEWRKTKMIFSRVSPLPSSSVFVDQVIGRLAAEENAAAQPAVSWALPKWLFPALGYGFAFLLMFIAIEHREASVSTSAVLLADVSQSSQWTFGDDPPDMNPLVSDPMEDV